MTEIEELKEENKVLRSCLESVSAYSKKQHDFSLKIAQDIVKRDSKAVANIVLNMRFGNMDNVSFCEIFDLRDTSGCKNHSRCTDCIHEFLQNTFSCGEEEKGGGE